MSIYRDGAGFADSPLPIVARMQVGALVDSRSVTLQLDPFGGIYADKVKFP